MALPTQQELAFHVDEIGWSLVSMVTSLKVSRIGERDSDSERSQAGFDACLLHMRAIIEFLAVNPDGHIHASHYDPNWDGVAVAAHHGLDIRDLYKDLNFHAAHLSRVRYKQQPTPGWDALQFVEQLLATYGSLVDSTTELQQELFDKLTEARLQVGILRQIENQN
jgi:hypothetical protein